MNIVGFSPVLMLAVAASFVGLESQALAVDTSGCSPMFTKSATLASVDGFLLQVESQKPNSERCWNVGNAGYTLRYSWAQNSAESSFKDVGFWTRANGLESFVPAYVSCHEVSMSGLGHNTSGKTLFQCDAVASVRIGAVGDYDIEVAPVRDGKWDTAGYNANYRFGL